MAINIETEIETALQAAIDNADWDSPYSVNKARARLVALRKLNDLQPVQSGDDTAQQRYESRVREIERIEAVLDNEADGVREDGFVRGDFTEMRRFG